MTRIVVEVEDGMVRTVFCSDPNAVVEVIDFDNEDTVDEMASRYEEVCEDPEMEVVW